MLQRTVVPAALARPLQAGLHSIFPPLGARALSRRMRPVKASTPGEPPRITLYTCRDYTNKSCDICNRSVRNNTRMSSTFIRGLALLETIDLYGPITVTELAQRTGVDKSTVSRTLAACEPDGWVVRTEGRVALGPREIGRAHV